MHLNLFAFGCGHHQAAWRHPNPPVGRRGESRFYEELAQTAERGRLDAVFFADGASVGKLEDGPLWFLEPLTCLAAMSRTTRHIGLVSTVSSTFYTPFHAARLLASLAHIYGGRIGLDVVASMFVADARHHGHAAMPAHAQHSARAD